MLNILKMMHVTIKPWNENCMHTQIYTQVTHVPDFSSEITDGLMQFGGTSSRVRMRSFGCENCWSMHKSGKSERGIWSTK